MLVSLSSKRWTTPPTCSITFECAELAAAEVPVTEVLVLHGDKRRVAIGSSRCRGVVPACRNIQGFSRALATCVVAKFPMN